MQRHSKQVQTGWHRRTRTHARIHVHAHPRPPGLADLHALDLHERGGRCSRPSGGRPRRTRSYAGAQEARCATYASIAVVSP
eukprot:6187835-Pleurochrysis_carterae.AAC.3